MTMEFEIGRPLLLALILCHECEGLGMVSAGREGKPEWPHLLGRQCMAMPFEVNLSGWRPLLALTMYTVEPRLTDTPEKQTPMI